MNKINNSLRKFDEDWFKDVNIKDGDTYSLCSELTQYLFDTDFDINKQSWKVSERICQIFGVGIWYEVLRRLFNREHDT